MPYIVAPPGWVFPLELPNGKIQIEMQPSDLPGSFEIIVHLLREDGMPMICWPLHMIPGDVATLSGIDLRLPLSALPPDDESLPAHLVPLTPSNPA